MTLVWLALHPQLPTSQYYSRAELCRYLTTDNNYCQAMTKILIIQKKYSIMLIYYYTVARPKILGKRLKKVKQYIKNKINQNQKLLKKHKLKILIFKN